MRIRTQLNKGQNYRWDEKLIQAETGFKQKIRASVPVEIYTDVLETVPVPDSSGTEKATPPAQP